MPSEMPSVNASSTWLCGRVGPSTRTDGQHPPPRADDHHGLLGGVKAVLIERLHRRQLVARAEQRFRRARRSDGKCRAEMLTTSFGGSRGSPLALRRQRAEHDLADDPFDRRCDRAWRAMLMLSVACSFALMSRLLSRSPVGARPRSACTPAAVDLARASRRLISWSTTRWSTSSKRTQMRQALVAELRAVGHDDHFFGRVHHRPLGFDQQQVAVVESALVDARHAQHACAAR